MLHENCYIAANCNHTPTAVDWGRNNLICYASCNSILIYDPNFGSGGKIISTLVYHKKRVNSVRWLRGVDYETELVAGSSDGETTVWTLHDKNYVFTALKQHESNVNLVDGLYKGPKNCNAIIVTISMDFTANIWLRSTSNDNFQLLQKISFGRSICVGSRLSLLPDRTTILACALDNSNISLYIENDPSFVLSNVLKGHEDWVRGLDFINSDDKFILASSSQDFYIRLWKFIKIIGDFNGDDNGVVQTKLSKYKIELDSILTGHEGWIFSVNWSLKHLQLLTASLDKSMVIWELDKNSNLWLEKIRVGEIGGNTLGFYGGIFSPDGNCILAHSYHGAFHIWKNTEIQGWQPCVTVGGHFGEVVDLSWEPNGEFLISVSTDQTTRIHAPWSRNGEKTTWHEIARPQIHGYDMSALAVISRYKFASAAEEKVIRTFQAPTNFVENFRRICHIVEDKEGDVDCGPKGASVPSLGLSNKAVFKNDDYINSSTTNDDDLTFSEVTLIEPPTEETLLQNTLWPEIQKLYGHGYEVYSLAPSPDGRFLASACKATTPEHATVILWDVSTWTQYQKLASHTLTVVQIAFSPDSQHLLTVSRDRRWSLFSKNIDDKFELVATTDKKTSIHTRIIWCCSWSHDSKYFCTGSRDGKVVVWTKNRQNPELNCLGDYGPASDHLEMKNESITAVTFAPKLISLDYLIAVGFESGIIQLYNWNTNGWSHILTLTQDLAHHLTVRRLKFRPVKGNSNENIVQLASCGNDWAVKIHNFLIN